MCNKFFLFKENNSPKLTGTHGRLSRQDYADFYSLSINVLNCKHNVVQYGVVDDGIM